MGSFCISELAGRVLEVNLGIPSVQISTLDEAIYRLFLGGRGLNRFLLSKALSEKTQPLDMENLLVFSAGLLVGTSTPGAIRLSIDSKSTFSGGVGSANVGGDFARELKMTGFGTIIVTGVSDIPVYLLVTNGEAELVPANHLWGKTTMETVCALRSELGKTAKVLCIGPAGERLVRGAAIIADGVRAASKCGVGSIMGSKKLKAVVAIGTGKVQVANSKLLEVIARRLWRKLGKSQSAQGKRLDGTVGSIVLKNSIGGIPYHHYQDGYMPPERLSKLSADSFKRYEKRRFGTKGCAVGCRSIHSVRDGVYKGTTGEGIQANSVQGFGYKLDIPYPPAILKAHLLCNDYGIDLDMASESIAWAFECFERGTIAEKDTGGLILKWGNHNAVMKLIRQIGYREEFGDILAEGSWRAARQVGGDSSSRTVTMKFQDIYETLRVPKGYGLGTALANEGGGHCSGSPMIEFVPGVSDHKVIYRTYGLDPEAMLDPFSYKDKGKLVAYQQRLHAILNSLGICLFNSISSSLDLLNIGDITEVIRATTGWDMEADELFQIGERIHTLERRFNFLHGGLDREHDYPPERFFSEPVRSGPRKGELLDKRKFDGMLEENYQAHGWDSNGLPMPETLGKLGIDNL